MQSASRHHYYLNFLFMKSFFLFKESTFRQNILLQKHNKPYKDFNKPFSTKVYSVVLENKASKVIYLYKEEFI